MGNDRAQEVLYESEAALRLVDQGLHDLHDVQHDMQHDMQHDEHCAISVGFEDLSNILERANQQILGILSRLRESRAALQSSAIEKLHVTHDKFREVTSATEDAAINIMDACDRATGLVDELDAIDAQPTPDRTKSSALRGTLRDELSLMMGALQFQDITSQQLDHASAVLVEMEQRLDAVAKLFESGALDAGAISLVSTMDTSTFDPNATTRNSEGRQALADKIFTSIKAPAA